jgi:RimJ/RimL family protein N-acetyltransferase
MGSHVVVRPIRPADEMSLAYLLIGEREDMNRTEVGALDLLDELSDHTDLTLVALDGDRLAGFVALRRGRKHSDQHVAQLRIHVARRHRSNGVGEKLLRRATFWADRKGIERIVATPYISDLDDEPAKLGFFKKHGFKIEGEARKFARLLDCTYIDAALMARLRHSWRSRSS